MASVKFYKNDIAYPKVLADKLNKLADMPGAMEFKGSLGVGGTITTLPTDGSAKKGDTYKVITDGTYAGESAKIGDLFICNGQTESSNTWVLIPSGDEPSGTVTNVATGTGLTGGPITSSGTISHADTSSQANVTNTGRTYIQSVELDGMGHVTKLTSATETGGGVDARQNDNKLYLVGARTQTNNPVTGSDYNVYETAGKLHADKFEVGAGSATGDNSVAHGYIEEDGKIIAEEEGAHAEGYVDYGTIKASGRGSHAEGTNTTASGDYSHAEGVGAYETVELELTAHLHHICENKRWGCDLFIDIQELNNELGTYYEKNSEILNDLDLTLNDTYITLPNDTSIFESGYEFLAGKTVQITNSTHDNAENDHISFNDVEFEFSGNTYNIEDVITPGNDNPDITISVYVTASVSNAIGKGSHTEGGTTTAYGDYSHAEGWNTRANGIGSHSEGYNTFANGDFSSAKGHGTIADRDYMTAIGKYNATGDTNTLFVVGNGNSNNNRSNAFYVNSSGNCYASGAYYASSDIRKKDVVKEISLDKAYELVEKCQTILYTWKDDEEKQLQIGLLAQEVQDYFPELVSEGSDGYLTLDYSKLTVILLAVIRDLTARVKHLETLEERIKSLEEKLR